MNVSSIVVKTAPENMKTVMAGIKSLDFCEVHFYDEQGRIIATIEGESIHDQIEIMKRIQNMPFVLHADLAYAYCENE